MVITNGTIAFAPLRIGRRRRRRRVLWQDWRTLEAIATPAIVVATLTFARRRDQAQDVLGFGIPKDTDGIMAVSMQRDERPLALAYPERYECSVCVGKNGRNRTQRRWPVSKMTRGYIQKHYNFTNPLNG